MKELLIFVGLAFLQAAHAYQVTDDRGVSINFDKPPQRIVSLLPSLAETVCALGQCDRLVGVDRYSNDPDRVKNCPRLAAGWIRTLRPSSHSSPIWCCWPHLPKAGERLQALGLKVMALEPKTHADVRQVLEKLGQVLGVGDAQRVWQGIEAGMQTAAQSLPARFKTTRVYFEVNSAPYAAGESSFIGETLSRLGVQKHCARQHGAVSTGQPGICGAR